MKLKIISSDCDISSLENENNLLKIIDLSIPLNNQVVEYYINDRNELKSMEEFFGIQVKEIIRNIFVIYNIDYKRVNYEWFESNYEKYLGKTNKGNTMDEYGSLLCVINILENNKEQAKYLIVSE